jgi:predicted anti-sigma-YlaC factor YlaD
MDCEETRSLLDGHLDGESEHTRHFNLEAHLAACSRGQDAAGEAVNFDSSLRVKIPVYQAPPALKATIQKALREESGESAPGTAGLVKRMRGFME